jgi:predicted nuclease of predicted toxin-antitoxin system
MPRFWQKSDTWLFKGGWLVKFKIDENLPIDVADLFRSAGHDVESVYSENLQGSPDQDLFQKCQIGNRVLATLDNDFANIIAYPPENNKSVIVLRVKDQSRDAVLKVFRRLLPELGKLTSGQLWVVDEIRIRIREGTI